MRLFKLLLSALALSAAALASADQNSELNDRFTDLKGTVQSINGELSDQRAAIGRLKAEIEAVGRESAASQRTLIDELKTLRRQTQALYDSMLQGSVVRQNEDGSVTEIKPMQNYDQQTPDGKMILGGEEYVYVKEARATFSARVDTGASISSISARDITRIERDGKSLVRFTIESNDRTITVEAPFVRTEQIRQSSVQDRLHDRLVVRLSVKLGDYSASTLFTLTDRSKMKFPVLLGRTLLKDIAVVDVARAYIQKRADKDGLIILDRDSYKEAVKRGENPNAAFDEKARENVSGMPAKPDSDRGLSMGSDSQKALPQVADRIARERLESSAKQGALAEEPAPEEETDPARDEDGEAVPAGSPSDSAAAAGKKRGNS